MSTTRDLLNMPYVAGGGDHQQLDLFLPSGGSAPRPLAVYIHGGGWQEGSKRSDPLRPLVDAGYAVASIEYRFSQQAVFPAQIEDCKAALRWLRAHAAEFNLDPARVGVMGESAGAHLAALLGTTGQTRQFDVGENLDQSSAVEAVVDYYGPTDFLSWSDGPPLAEHAYAMNAVAHLLGGPVAAHLDLARSASPLLFVDKHSAPFLIVHGDKDPIVPWQQSQSLAAALKQVGVESTLVIIPGAGHSGSAFGGPDNFKRVKDFLDRHLRPDGPL